MTAPANTNAGTVWWGYEAIAVAVGKRLQRSVCTKTAKRWASSTWCAARGILRLPVWRDQVSGRVYLRAEHLDSYALAREQGLPAGAAMPGRAA